MISPVNLCLVLTALLASRVNGGFFGLDSQIGKVGSLATFEFYNKESGSDILASVDVEGDVVYEDVKEFLTDFSSSKETKIVIHGWNNNDRKPFAKEIIGSFLPAFDYNVIFVDWSPEAFQFYPRAVQAVPKIAHLVAQLVDILVKNYSASLDNIHIIGHSLGAQVAGIAGLHVESGNVSRVTGLDPAKPLFSMAQDDRLRPESANFVDVIHTCSNYLSFYEPIGHVDFYPNGGIAVQPGCGFRDMIGGKCSHGRSYNYFAESINNPENFLGTQCDSWNDYINYACDNNPTEYMGESVSTSARGVYYLRTNSESPFGLGDDS